MSYDKYPLERDAAASIVQHGTPEEKARLKAELDDFFGVMNSGDKERFGGKSTEQVLYLLSKVDLADKAERERVSKFMEQERKLKGGNAGTDFEEPFRILEKNIGIVNEEEKRKAQEEKAVAEKTREKVTEERVFTKIADMLTKRGDVTAQVRARAHNVQSEILCAAKRNDPEVIRAISLLVNPTVSNTEFQLALGLTEGTKADEADGKIGRITINKLFELAGSGYRLEVVRKKVETQPVAPKKDTEQKHTAPTAPKTDTDVKHEAENEKKREANRAQAEKKTTVSGKPESLSYHDDVAKVQGALAAWRIAVKWAAGSFGLKLTGDEERKANQELIDAAYKSLEMEMGSFSEKYIAGKDNEYAKQNTEWLKSIYNEIAMYLRGEGVRNQHYRNPVTAEKLLKLMLVDKWVTLPQFPNEAQLLAKLDDGTKKLIQIAIDSGKEKGKSFEQALGEALGSPLIKGAWDEVKNKGLGEYEKSMRQAIEKLESKQLTAQEKASLDQLKEIYGTKGWWHMKDSTWEKTVMVRDQLFAVGLGVAGFAAISTGVGSALGVPMTLAAASIVGGTLATGASMALSGRVYSGTELAQEGSINVGTFFVGGILFKVFNSARVVGKIGTIAATTFEWAGNVGIGVGVDQLRAHFAGVEISGWESFKNNLAFALLPLAVRGLHPAWEALTARTVRKMEEANINQALWNKDAVKQAIDEINNDVAATKATVGAPDNATSTKTAQSETASPSRKPTIMEKWKDSDWRSVMKDELNSVKPGNELAVSEKISIKKRADGKYEIYEKNEDGKSIALENGRLFKQKEVLDTLWERKDRTDFMTWAAKEAVTLAAPKKAIKFRGEDGKNYKVGPDEIIVKEKSGPRKLSASEVDEFYQANGEKLLREHGAARFEKARVELVKSLDDGSIENKLAAALEEYRYTRKDFLSFWQDPIKWALKLLRGSLMKPVFVGKDGAESLIRFSRGLVNPGSGKFSQGGIDTIRTVLFADKHATWLDMFWTGVLMAAVPYTLSWKGDEAKEWEAFFEFLRLNYLGVIWGNAIDIATHDNVSAGAGRGSPLSGKNE